MGAQTRSWQLYRTGNDFVMVFDYHSTDAVTTGVK